VDLVKLHDGSCPLLDSLWNETIRMSAYSASVRFITRDTVIGGKILRKGNRLMIPYRQLHFDEEVFGRGIDQFRPERFDEKANLTRSDNWRPFGGGTTMCPGRYVAKRAVMLFVAMLLRKFDLEMVGGPETPVPDAEQGKPVLGIMSVKEGQDLMVRLTRRK
jgi:cytochrome P450